MWNSESKKLANHFRITVLFEQGRKKYVIAFSLAVFV